MAVEKRLPWGAKLSIAFALQLPALVISEARGLCGSATGDGADGFPALTAGVVAALVALVLGRLPDWLHRDQVLFSKIRYWSLRALTGCMLLGLLLMLLARPGFPGTYVFYLSWGGGAGLWLSKSALEPGVATPSAE